MGRSCRANSGPDGHRELSNVKIIVQHRSGADTGRSESFPLGSIRIGRAASCEVKLDLHRDLEVSNEHCEIYLDPERGLCLRDLSSTNGTYLNGVPIADEPIQHGAKIELGAGGVELRVLFKRTLVEILTGKSPAAPSKVTG